VGKFFLLASFESQDYDLSMQSLRDKLLKAGAVSKDEARKSRQESRKKKKKGRQGAEEAARKEAARKQAFEQRKDVEAQNAKARSKAENEAKERKEKLYRLKQIIERRARLKVGGDQRPFYFLMPDGRIRRFNTTFAIAEDLRDGKLGIAHAPYDESQDFRVIDKQGVERLEQLDKSAILFWNHPTNESDLPTYGAGPASAIDRPAKPLGTDA
jgi:uncharacterized protein YaiL (DUF2058 family)